MIDRDQSKNTTPSISGPANFHSDPEYPRPSTDGIYSDPKDPHLDDDPIDRIRQATVRGRALGDEGFIREMEARTGTRPCLRRPGLRPRSERGEVGAPGSESESLP